MTVLRRALLPLAAAVALLSACSSSPSSFTVQGQVTVPNGAPSGSGCSGTSETLGFVAPQSTVKVTYEDGSGSRTGKLDAGRLVGSNCEFTVTVPGVHSGADAYMVQVGTGALRVTKPKSFSVTMPN
jgi:hypothetical protein